jgi:hypothetical protein
MTVPSRNRCRVAQIKQRGVPNWAKVQLLEAGQSFFNLLQISHCVGFGVPGVDNDQP